MPLGNVPVINSVKVLQQRFVQHFNRIRIRKIDGFIVVHIQPDELSQFRTTDNQWFEIIAFTMPVSRMEAGFFFRVFSLFGKHNHSVSDFPGQARPKPVRNDCVNLI